MITIVLLLRTWSIWSIVLGTLQTLLWLFWQSFQPLIMQLSFQSINTINLGGTFIKCYRKLCFIQQVSKSSEIRFIFLKYFFSQFSALLQFHRVYMSTCKEFSEVRQTFIQTIETTMLYFDSIVTNKHQARLLPKWI